MRDPKRINPIIERLRAIWLSSPDLRLSQLILNVCEGKQSLDAYNWEDDKFIEKLESLYFKC